MARTEPSVNDALQRWEEPYVLGIDTEVSTGDGLYNASLRVRSVSGAVNCVVTDVESESVWSSVDEVQKAFTQLLHAPGDASALAAEVKRLREQVRQLKEKNDGQ